MEKKIQIQMLKQFCIELLKAVDVPVEDSKIIADVLIETEQRGVQSHGVSCLLRYISLIQQGIMRPDVQWEVIRTSGAVEVWDGLHSNGQVIGHYAMKRSMEQAKKYGIGLVAVKHSSHFAAGAYYAEMAQKERMVGVVTSTGASTMAPWGGTDKLIGNNPLSIAIPANEQAPIVLDMAQSNVALGRILNLRSQGKTTVPEGWAFDCNGEETTDIDSVHTVQPAGGYKGFGMSLVIDLLSGTLFGGATGERALDEAEGPAQVFCTLNINAFSEYEDFVKGVDERIKELKASKLKPGFESIRMPGERAFESRFKQETEVMVIAEVVEKLNQLAQELGVTDQL